VQYIQVFHQLQDDIGRYGFYTGYLPKGGNIPVFREITTRIDRK